MKLFCLVIIFFAFSASAHIICSNEQKSLKFTLDNQHNAELQRDALKIALSCYYADYWLECQGKIDTTSYFVSYLENTGAVVNSNYESLGTLSCN